LYPISPDSREGFGSSQVSYHPQKKPFLIPIGQNLPWLESHTGVGPIEIFHAKNPAGLIFNGNAVISVKHDSGTSPLTLLAHEVPELRALLLMPFSDRLLLNPLKKLKHDHTQQGGRAGVDQ